MRTKLALDVNEVRHRECLTTSLLCQYSVNVSGGHVLDR